MITNTIIGLSIINVCARHMDATRERKPSTCASRTTKTDFTERCQRADRYRLSRNMVRTAFRAKLD